MADELASTRTAQLIDIPKPTDLPQESVHATPLDTSEYPSLPDTSQDTASDKPHNTSAEDEMTHHKAMGILREGLGEILEADPLLSDLPAEVTAEEVNLQIALEYGQAMTVCVQKFTGEIMPIVVLQGARVQDLRQAIQRYVTLKESRKGSQTSISWKYIWRTYSLCFEEDQLDKNKKLKEYGIRNRDTVTFVKRRRQAGDRY